MKSIVGVPEEVVEKSSIYHLAARTIERKQMTEDMSQKEPVTLNIKVRRIIYLFGEQKNP